MEEKYSNRLTLITLIALGVSIVAIILQAEKPTQHAVQQSLDNIAYYATLQVDVLREENAALHKKILEFEDRIEWFETALNIGEFKPIDSRTLISNNSIKPTRSY